ncbi:MAG TPA: polysaccharide deacetylase family protein [Nitrososphaeraceae archaeon]|nr:polysaccharide deacetylase family protein [Nitrososphaeraceae archaeon]
MIVNKNCFSKVLLFIGRNNYLIINQKPKKIVLTSSFLLLIINTFIPIASAQKAIILNFDDDWKGQLTYAVPILEKYGFKASFFVTTGCLTYQNSSFCNNAGGDSAMTWEDINLLSELGYDIQSHGASHKDLTTLSASDLEYEVRQSKQSLLEHGINSTIFGPPYGAGWGNSTIVDTISKYYDMARVGFGRLAHLNCDWTYYEMRIHKTNQTDCRTYSDNGTLTLANRYSLLLLSDYEEQARYGDNSTKILDIFLEAMNYQTQFNSNGTITALPIVVYHNIDYKNNSSDTTPEWIKHSTIDVNLFDVEMKYLHDNGFKVLTMSDLGYNQTNNKLYIKNNTDDTF